MSSTIEIYTDGACRGNPGPGGWGALLIAGRHRKTMHGGEPDTTNNRMELIGAISGLEALTRPCRVSLTTDSEYVKKGMTEWIDGWVKRGWKNTQKKPVANRDLWERLLEVAEQHQVEWHWVRGHDGHAENERCDALARAAIETGRSG